MLYTLVIPFLIYWLLFFVINFIVLDYGQRYLYDEPTPSYALKVTLGSFLLAMVSTWLHPSFDTMFTSGLWKTVLNALIWFGVFTLLYQFQPWHGAGIGVVLAIFVPVMATLTNTTLMQPTERPTASSRPTNAPLRRSSGGVPPAADPPKKDADK